MLAWDGEAARAVGGNAISELPAPAPLPPIGLRPVLCENAAVLMRVSHQNWQQRTLFPLPEPFGLGKRGVERAGGRVLPAGSGAAELIRSRRGAC